MKHNLTVRMLHKMIKNNKGMFTVMTAVIIAVVFLSLVPPQIIKTIIDSNIVPKNADGLLELALIYLGVIVAIGILDFFKGSVLTILGQKIVKYLRMEMTGKLEKLSVSYFTENTAAEITSRFTNDVDNINSLFADGLISMIIDCFKIVGIIASIWIFSAELGVVTLCLIPLIYAVSRAFQKHMLSSQVRNLEQISKVTGHISESVKNIRMIKSFNKEAYLEELYKKRLEDNFSTVERVNFYDSCYPPVIQVARALVIAIVVLLSGSRTDTLGISLGMVAASIDLVSNLFSPIEALGTELQNIQKGISGIKRINRFGLEPEEPRKNDDLYANDIQKDIAGAGLSFSNVSFSYETGQPVLENLELKIKSGTSITFTGRTGVGKTTLFRLIMGLLKPTEGRILLGYADVYEIPDQEKRKLFGYVEQQFTCICGTVAQQISLKDEDISMEQIVNAMRFVGLHDHIMNMEHGYDTEVDPDADFSQGQKQLLSIGRAIVYDPPVLLLDEVTADLDSVTEARIVTVLQKAGRGKTVLSISHRITSMLNCDTIVMLENGRITAAGAPKDILESQKWFRRQLQLEQNKWKG
ncbi:MAG: ABC transporter ATP-binding protein [Clostridia bacterium]